MVETVLGNLFKQTIRVGKWRSELPTLDLFPVALFASGLESQKLLASGSHLISSQLLCYAAGELPKPLKGIFAVVITEALQYGCFASCFWLPQGSLSS